MSATVVQQHVAVDARDDFRKLQPSALPQKPDSRDVTTVCIGQPCPCAPYLVTAWTETPENVADIKISQPMDYFLRQTLLLARD